MAEYDDFEELATAVQQHLSTLDATALEDPEAPSPLSYAELNGAGRADLVQGCMKHGGYLAVSRQLGVRLNVAPPPPPKVNPWTSQLPVEEETQVGVSLSGIAKEEKMAADLARLANKKSQPANAATATRSVGGSSTPTDRLAPIPTSVTAADTPTRAREEPAILPTLFFDGFQRAETGLLAVLFAVGFGRTSTEVLPPSLIPTVQVAFSLLLVAHLAIGGYGAFLASKVPPGKHSPPLWFVKLVITGAGGFRELQRSL
eukprot:CAMPEP_0115832914 /NCGR_PEP_ID=MMETSP0287-20121206/2903_1 /TAXON_ID=412157 /ORGANISM="Chrysochromulina rotalis, Strain UIO044" /LENGTH=258 /DNA_ID=CAMNT_0003286313 /DNA_START=61 /DNA_END=837 /DNA_ORIENTATION=+